MSVRERERKKWETINSFGYKKGICYMLQKIGKVKHMGTRGPKGTPLAMLFNRNYTLLSFF